MATSSKRHPLEKAWNEVFKEIGLPVWLPRFAVDLKKTDEGVDVGGLKVVIENEKDKFMVARALVDLINENRRNSGAFCVAMAESVEEGSVSANMFRLMVNRRFFPERTLANVDWMAVRHSWFIGTSQGLMIRSFEEIKHTYVPLFKEDDDDIYAALFKEEG